MPPCLTPANFRRSLRLALVVRKRCQFVHSVSELIAMNKDKPPRRPLALDLGPEGRPGFADGGILFLHNHKRMLDLLLGEEDVELIAKERP